MGLGFKGVGFEVVRAWERSDLERVQGPVTMCRLQACRCRDAIKDSSSLHATVSMSFKG